MDLTAVTAQGQMALGKYIWLGLAFIFVMLAKDILTTITYGLMFYFDRSFNEGDNVYLDDQRALIIKIGIRKTCFQIQENDETHWRYIPNDKIRYAKLEKIIGKNHGNK